MKSDVPTLSFTLSEKLEPCPFCGNVCLEIVSNGVGDYYIFCAGDGEDGDPLGCGARTSDVRCESKKHAIQRWNTRACSTQGDKTGMSDTPDCPNCRHQDWKQVQSIPTLEGRTVYLTCLNCEKLIENHRAANRLLLDEMKKMVTEQTERELQR
jgi:hypothetical protein